MKASYRQAAVAADLVFCLARLAGFEPATRCLEGSCSIRLSYRRLPNVLCSIQVTQRPHRLDNGHDRDLAGMRAGSRAAVLQGRAVVKSGELGDRDPAPPRGHVRRAADGRHRAFAAYVDFRSEPGHRPDLTRPGRRAAWPVVYPGSGVRHD